jgi:acetyl/propionyl-CoA carboxylase alpha subunit/acetyl-CoA carboxylase carboxyltransferase component
MTIRRLLIANRGEIAIRIARACAELDITSVAIFSEDDCLALHARKADEAAALHGVGAKAYLDVKQILQLAQAHQCDAIHPGYGFLSENPAFAEACEQAGVIFVGPSVDTLRLFGDKAKARELASGCNIPLPCGTCGAGSLGEIEKFWHSLGDDAAIMIKAVVGGGGRGMRPVFRRDDLADAYERCQSEATAAFGVGDVYAEQLVLHARHIEVQIIGDGTGEVAHLGERECSLQRRHQKLIEVAPSPSLSTELRERLFEAALKLGRHCQYRGLGTVEFLVNREDEAFFFIETNPRIQVEHTVTEAVSGVDLVMAQLQIAGGASLFDLHLTQAQISPPNGYAVQLRINMETMNSAGEVIPTGGTLGVFELPSGPGVRVDSFGYAGYHTSPHYDSLLAKLIIHSRSLNYGDAIKKASRSLRECRIVGVETNISLLHQLLKTDAVVRNDIYTRYLDEHMGELLSAEEQASHSPLYFEAGGTDSATHLSNVEQDAPEGSRACRAPMQSVIVEVSVLEGEQVLTGQQVAVVEAMKMEHVVSSDIGGIVRRVDLQAGDGLQANQPILYIEPIDGLVGKITEQQVLEPDFIRPDLQELRQRLAKIEDKARPEAIAKRHAKGKRTARENVADLVDPDSLLEYGGMAVAAQRSRRSLDDLEQNTPADGLIAGLATVNGNLFADDENVDDKTRCGVLCYDYTVLAGTQGYYNHHKTDRLLEIVREQQLPLIFFCEGGGGRPGDTDFPDFIGLSVPTFTTLATLSGLVPTVGIVSGRCFAGNAAMLGCHDVIIATRDASIGMAGPALIEGGGLGQFHPDEIGPVGVHTVNGVIDILVEGEAEAVVAAKKYLSYFQGKTNAWNCADQRGMRHHIPENRLRSYDVRTVIFDLADTDSVLELRPHFGESIITAFIRIEGRPLGLIANNSRHLGGAIDSPAADKAARFIQLCNGHDIPIVSLLDTPGFMVGPEAEKTAQVRHFSRMFVTAANANIPFFVVCLRKGYGLGAQAMAAGSFHDPMFTISWPTGEFGPMGLEGSVRLGFKKELEAAGDEVEKKVLFDKLLANAYKRGKAIRAASTLDLDSVIDPAQTRDWLVKGLKYAKAPAPRDGKKVPFIDVF